MTHRTDAARGRDIIARWCGLAERRLEHLTELFESGRWRRYHSEVAFLENITEAKAAVETWRDLLSREAMLDNSAIDLSWLGRPRSRPPYDETWRRRFAELPPLPVAPTFQVSSATTEAAKAVPSEVPPRVAAPALDDVPIPVLDLARMHERYPLLRNAL